MILVVDEHFPLGLQRKFNKKETWVVYGLLKIENLSKLELFNGAAASTQICGKWISECL